MEIDFGVLGPLEVRRGGTMVGVTSASQRLLLATLLVRRNEVVAVDVLADVLWHGRPPPSAKGVVQNHVSHLRKLLAAGGRGVLQTVGSGYRMAPDAEDVDAVWFERQAAAGRVALGARNYGEAADRLRGALGLWRGAAYADVVDAELVWVEARRLDALRAMAVEDRVEADLGLGRHRELVGELEALVLEFPLQERLWAQLMRALYRSGRQADALRASQRLRRQLAEELGLDPGPEVAQLETAILTHAPSLQWSARTPSARPMSRAKGVGSDTTPGVGEVDRHRPPTVWPTRHELVGRHAELGVLWDWWHHGTAGDVALIVGESGVGKTRLAVEFARRVHDDGYVAVYGQAAEAGGSSYEPVLGALRNYIGVVDDATLAAWSDSTVGAFARLVPEILERYPARAVPIGWSDVDRSWLLAAVAESLGGDGDPVLVVLDDLQWADRAGMLLLSRLIVPASRARVLATYRSPGPTSPDHLTDLFAELHRDDRTVRRVFVRGFDLDEVGEYVAELTGSPAGDSARGFVADLHRRTGGHPFFIRETVRQLEDMGAIAPAAGAWGAPDVLKLYVVPDGVRDMVGQRLAHLSAATRSVLGAAAVIGLAFDIDLVAAAADLSEDEVVAAIVEATSGGLVHDHTTGVDRYQFTHALIHDVVLAELNRSRRVRLEWRSGEALEVLRSRDLDELAGDVALHLSAGVAVGDPRKTAQWCRRAAEGAMARLAYEDAIHFYEMALIALELCAAPVIDERIDVLCALGRAANVAGDPQTWLSSCREAAAAARLAADPDRLARAAIDLLGTRGPGPLDVSLVALFDEAADALRTAQPTAARQALLAEVLTRACGHLSNSDPDRSAALGAEALAVARQAGDPRALALALIHSTDTHDLEREEHLLRLREAAHFAELAGDPAVILAATSNLMAGALTWADRDEFDHGLAEYARIAKQMRAPTPQVLSAIDHAGATALNGHYAQARNQFHEALLRCEPLGDPSLGSNIKAGMRNVHRELGTTSELLDTTDPLATEPYVGGLPVVYAYLLCEMGRLDEARTHFDALLSRPELIHARFFRRVNLAHVSEIVERLAHTDGATVVYPWVQAELRHGLCIIIGPNTFFGAVDRCLGLLDHTLGRIDDSVHHHTVALDIHERVRAQGWAARSRYDLGRALLARASSRDTRLARKLIAEATRAAQNLGMTRLLTELDALDNRVPSQT